MIYDDDELMIKTFSLIPPALYAHSREHVIFAHNSLIFAIIFTRRISPTGLIRVSRWNSTFALLTLERFLADFTGKTGFNRFIGCLKKWSVIWPMASQTEDCESKTPARACVFFYLHLKFTTSFSVKEIFLKKPV